MSQTVQQVLLCLGLWYTVQLNDGPNCTAERVAVLCIGLWNRVQLNDGINFKVGCVAVLRIVFCTGCS